MAHNERGRPARTDRPATTTITEAEFTPEGYPWWAGDAWRLAVDLATAPRHQVYAAGVLDGIELERRRREPLDDAAHRGAVRRALRLVEVVDRRERAGRGEVA